MKLKFLRTSLNQSNICCSFFWGKFLQDEEVSETSASDYGSLRIGFEIKKACNFSSICKFNTKSVQKLSLCEGAQHGLNKTNVYVRL